MEKGQCKGETNIFFSPFRVIPFPSFPSPFLLLLVFAVCHSSFSFTFLRLNSCFVASPSNLPHPFLTPSPPHPTVPLPVTHAPLLLHPLTALWLSPSPYTPLSSIICYTHPITPTTLLHLSFHTHLYPHLPCHTSPSRFITCSGLLPLPHLRQLPPLLTSYLNDAPLLYSPT